MRLTNQIRDAILSNVIEKTFQPKVKALEEEGKALGLKVYREVVGEEDIKAMNGLRPGILMTATSLHIDRFDDKNRKQRFPTGFFGETLPLPERLPVPMDKQGEFCVRDSHAFSKQVDDYFRKKEALNKESHEISRKTHAILRSVNTDKKLLEIWPEAKDYLPKPDHEPVTKGQQIGQTAKELQEQLEAIQKRAA